jgi:ATP-dependent helicase HrpB
METRLPIEEVIPEIVATLRRAGRLVLQAPPGAGKTTRVPLALLEAGVTPGRIVMLEPRRLAARAAAERMAHLLGEEVGQTVGFRIRGESRVGKTTRIEVVTEGVLTRMLQADPELPGVGTVIFDEFHERSLNADLGLALCLDVASALRDDLRLVVMSATLDATPVAGLMEAPVITSEGRSFDVTPHWLAKPLPKETRLEQATAERTLQALREAKGSALVFLPGEREIRRVEALLRGQVPEDCAVLPLYGALPFKDQRAAIAPMPDGARKVVLATSIAETSLTIEGIRIVVDAGLARRAAFDAGSGMSRLITTRVSRAEATQRAGRAGRLAPGVCYKLWTRGEQGALAAYPPAEIEVADLTGLALELANWGAEPDDLPFLTQPHPGRLSEARAVLHMLGALDQQSRITPHGRRLAQMPLHPRLAHMLQIGSTYAADLAALLSDRDILLEKSTSLQRRLDALAKPAQFGDAVHRAAVERVRAEAKRLRRLAPAGGAAPAGELAALAYPDRIGLRRPGAAPRYILSGGKGARMPEGDALAGERLIVATDLDGDPVEAQIRQAAPLAESALRRLFSDQIRWENSCSWSKREGRVRAVSEERFGALVLDSRPWRDVDPGDIARAMIEGVRQLGLRPEPAAQRFLARARLMHATDASFPDFDDEALLRELADWLLPFLDGVSTAEDWKKMQLLAPLQSRLSYAQQQTLDREVPAQYTTPLGRTVPIDYEHGRPAVALRLQEVFGVSRHPTVAGQPLQMTLLSPAQRPLQITDDLPGFWDSSYEDVRKDMRGRYPKHPWPDDPRAADPTLRAKRRS